MNFRRLGGGAALLALVCTFLFGAGYSAFAATPGPRSDAVVLVNSNSARFLDFKRYIQPYLDNFGVPYTVLDISTNAPANFSKYALIIIGHTQLDTNNTFLTAAVQSNLAAAVFDGTGLVNFDSALGTATNTARYQYVQDIFGFTYGAASNGNTVTFPATEPSSQMHFITSRHATNEPVALRTNISLAGLIPSVGVTPVALSTSNRPVLMVKKYGQGRAVQWTSYDWISMSAKGPLGGLDDLVWRGMVWSARKPFVMRGLPNFMTMRVDDVEGPLEWATAAISNGFKPWMGLFYKCITSNNVVVLRDMITNGNATASIHSFGCGGLQWFFFDHGPGLSGTNWSDAVISNNFAQGTAWHLSNSIPISKVAVAHYSEIGPNAFPWLKTWGVEFVPIEVVPGTIEYATPGAPWLIGAPYRLYEPPLEGQSALPFFYADFLAIPGHPELDGQFFNCYTEVRDDAGCQEWCPDNNVAASVGRGVRQLKRAFDSMAMGTLFTHEFYIHPNNARNDFPAITASNWNAILQGITNGVAAYNPQYVTLDYANQYVRATRTSHITSSYHDIVSGNVRVNLSGKTDLDISVQVYTGEDNAITNTVGTVPVFNGSTAITAAVVPPSPPPTLHGKVESNRFVMWFNSVPGQEYIVARNNDFGSGNWTVLTNITATGTNVVCSDSIDWPQCYYRLVLATADAGPILLNGSAQGGQFVLAFNARTGSSYTVERSTAFGPWSNLTNLIALSTNITVLDPINTNLQRNYRVGTPK